MRPALGGGSGWGGPGRMDGACEGGWVTWRPNDGQVMSKGDLGRPDNELGFNPGLGFRLGFG